jgi:hypothetical protein
MYFSIDTRKLDFVSFFYELFFECVQCSFSSSIGNTRTLQCCLMKRVSQRHMSLSGSIPKTCKLDAVYCGLWAKIHYVYAESAEVGKALQSALIL